MNDHEEVEETEHVLGAGMSVYTDSNDQITKFVMLDDDDKEVYLHTEDLDSGWEEGLMRLLEEAKVQRESA